MMRNPFVAALLVCVLLVFGPPVRAGAATPAPLTVMPLGDSITEGLGSVTTGTLLAWLAAHPGGSFPYDGYRTALRDRLAEAGADVRFVGSMHDGRTAHEGHPGWTIEQLNDVLADRLDTYRPDVILLHLGTNNARRDTYTADAPAAYRRTLRIIKAHDPAAVVFAAKIVDSSRYDARGETRARRIRRINAAIPGLVAAAGPNFHLVDMSGIHGLDLADAVHPNNVGYAKMAWKWYQALRTVLGGGRWPAESNPYTRTRVTRCINWTAAPFARHAVGCHTWYLRGHRWRLRLRTGSSTRWITGW